jgi:Ca-activated chloride channel family protein
MPKPWRIGVLAGLMLLAGCEGAPQGGNSAPPVAYAPAAAGAFALPGALGPAPANFANADQAPWRDVAETPVATLSLASDTTSYTVVKRLIGQGVMPHPAMVRPEEFLNYFRFDLPAPASSATPIQSSVVVLPAPWDSEHRLLHVAFRTFAPARAERPPLNLVFLIDVSGSMGPPDRLDLVRQGIGFLLPRLEARDRISLVTYASSTRVVLDSVPGDRTAEIAAAVAQLQAGGATAGGAGLQRAYALAARNFAPAAVNRVVLATDGDFNIGLSSAAELEAFITEKRRTGIYLSVLGVGLDNLNDRTMHTLAKAGNGTASYLGTLDDARRALVDDFAGNTLPVANDVKLSVEFNPARVVQYRQIGFETRTLRREDFQDDRVDAGEIGAGRTVTAIFEFVPVGASRTPLPSLRYAQPAPAPQPARAAGAHGQEYAFVQVRYKLPGQAQSRLVTRPVTVADSFRSFESAPGEARFATAVAAFALALRAGGGPVLWSMSDIADAAVAAKGPDADGRRAEFVAMVRLALLLRPVAMR